MSYARWSSHDYWSDVYVYADVAGGWATHVAGRRHVLTEPFPPEVDPADDADAWIARQRKVGALLDAAELVDIGLPHDGATYNDPTPDACADRLEELRDLGYHVPPEAIEALRQEATA